MSSVLNVLVVGSCVSRDLFEITATKEIKLVDYYARSSFASLGAEPINDEELINKVESKWQRSMLKRDLEKEIFNSIKNKNFDILLVDLIDERFNIAKIKGSLCTVSSEFKKYQDGHKYSSVKFDSDEKFEYWKKGFRKFIDELKKIDALDKLRVNKVYWSSQIDNNENFPEEYLSYIDKNNAFLKKMYLYIENFININQFIKYPNSLIVCAKEHKWGVQPFHFINDFYYYTEKSLKVLAVAKSKEKLLQQPSAGKVFNDLLSAYRSVKKGEFFVYKEGVMYPFKWDMTKGINLPIVFFTPGRTIRGKPMPVFQRSKYFDILNEYNCVSCFDPTLFRDSEINLAWFQGEKTRFYALELAAMWKEFVNKLKIDTKNILYYGSSGGGIPGFYLAKNTPNSTLYVSNIQTDVREYDPKTLKKLIETSFDNDSNYVLNAGSKQNRFTINGHSGVFNLIYSQNKADAFHYEHHYKKWKSETNYEFFKSIKFIEYNDDESGHGPLSASSEIGIIRGIIEGNDYLKFFPNSEIESILPKINAQQENFINIKHSAFSDYKLKLPIDWNLDPFSSKNWRHHLNSLRWLSYLDDKKKALVINDFYEFHIKNKIKNPYYNTRRGDHTISIRIEVLYSIKKHLEKFPNEKEKLNLIIKNDIQSLLKDSVYQENNHGLIADLSIIKAAKNGVMVSPISLDKTYSRLKKTLSKMYDEDGVCLEHSISYQEYNLLMLTELVNHLPKANIIAEVVEKIVEKSKVILGFHLLNNNQYIPLGDSFRLPNKNILKKIYGSENPQVALHPFSSSNGVFYSKSGYFVYKSIENDIHLSLVSGWHSHVHKQNDELSIFLYYKKHIIFDDPGYTDLKKWEEILDLKSELWHSNFTIENKDWSNIIDAPSGTEIQLLSSNPLNILAKHTRYKGIELQRKISVENNLVKIVDVVTGCINLDVTTRHKFLLADTFAIVSSDSVILYSKFNEVKLASIEAVGKGIWIIEKGKRVNEIRSEVIVSDLLIFRSHDNVKEFYIELY